MYKKTVFILALTFLSQSTLFSTGLFLDEPKKLTKLTKKEINQWKNIGISKSYINNWRSQGISTPKEAKSWMDAGVKSFMRAKEWKKKGIKPKETKLYKKIGIDTRNFYLINDWKRSGVKTVQEIFEWHKLGIDSYKIKQYFKNNISLKELKLWNDIGITDYRTILDLRKEGFETPQKVKKWLEIGIDTILEFKDIKNSNIKTPEELKKWLDAGMYNTGELKKIREANIKTPTEFKEWRDENIDIYDIKNWKKIGVSSPKLAGQWKSLTSLRIVPYWLEVGITEPTIAKQWQELNVSYSDISKVKQSNLTMEDIKKWRNINIMNIESIIDLKNAGFENPKQYEPYKVSNIYHSIILKELGIKPNDLIKKMSKTNIALGRSLYFSSKENFIDTYKVISKECQVMETNKLFINIDMSQNRNKCYLFTGKMFQRLDEESFLGEYVQKGLVSNTRNLFFAESFKGDWKEEVYKIGIIKGNGSFSYNSQGGRRVVPKGKVLFMKDLIDKSRIMNRW